MSATAAVPAASHTAAPGCQATEHEVPAAAATAAATTEHAQGRHVASATWRHSPDARHRQVPGAGAATGAEQPAGYVTVHVSGGSTCAITHQ